MLITPPFRSVSGSPTPKAKMSTKGRTMSDLGILDALNLLRIAYPTEPVEIWAESQPPHDTLKFTASVGPVTGTPKQEFAWGQSPVQAAERLIDKAGDRDPMKLRQQRIDKLKAELAALEAAQPPLSQQLSEPVQACESEPTAA